MLSRRFDQLYVRLAAAHGAYTSVPRTPERVRDLASARARLDDIRREIAEERTVVERFDELVRTYHAVDLADAEILRPTDP